MVPLSPPHHRLAITRRSVERRPSPGPAEFTHVYIHKYLHINIKKKKNPGRNCCGLVLVIARLKGFKSTYKNMQIFWLFNSSYTVNLILIMTSVRSYDVSVSLCRCEDSGHVPNDGSGFCGSHLFLLHRRQDHEGEKNPGVSLRLIQGVKLRLARGLERNLGIKGSLRFLQSKFSHFLLNQCINPNQCLIKHLLFSLNLIINYWKKKHVQCCDCIIIHAWLL